jgi:hypothetical protein
MTLFGVKGDFFERLGRGKFRSSRGCEEQEREDGCEEPNIPSKLDRCEV